ncbi:MAG: TIGR02647 family protein [Woeseiaceae bacterium]
MSYTAGFIDELNVLRLFDLANHQEGIKVHKEAGEQSIEAAQRLFDKGLIDQIDGGYLTDIGLEAAEHAQNLLMILTTK